MCHCDWLDVMTTRYPWRQQCTETTTMVAVWIPSLVLCACSLWPPGSVAPNYGQLCITIALFHTVCCSQEIIMTLVYNKPISLKSCFSLKYFYSLKDLFSLKSYMAPSIRVRGDPVSYKGMCAAPKAKCGAPAPWTSLPKPCSNINKESRGKKAAKLTSSNHLLFTTAGDRLPSMVVSGLILIIFLSLMNYSVVQWMPWWWRACTLYNLWMQGHLLRLDHVWNQRWCEWF